MEADRIVQDVRENEGAPDQYTIYMDLMAEIVETEPSYWEEEVEKPIWVDVMEEE